MKFTYKTNGVCSRSIDIEIENDTLVSVAYMGGCNGCLKGIAALFQGMNIDEVISRLEGSRCGFKSTSCPAQLAEALKQYKSQKD